MPRRMRLTVLCAAGALAAGLVAPAAAQQDAHQPAPPAAAPSQGDAQQQPGAAPAIPEQWRPPSGCPYRNQKLELIA